MTSNQNFNGMPLFDVEYLTNGKQMEPQLLCNAKELVCDIWNGAKTSSDP